MGKKSKSKKSNRSLLLVLVMLGVWQMPYTFVILCGLLPSGVVWLIDRGHSKLTAVTIAAMNGIALVPILIHLWDQGGGMTAAMSLMGSTINWVLILLAVIVGWSFAQGVPNFVVSIILNRERAHIKRMKEGQRLLIEEWGDDVADGFEKPNFPSK